MWENLNYDTMDNITYDAGNIILGGLNFMSLFEAIEVIKDVITIGAWTIEDKVKEVAESAVENIEEFVTDNFGDAIEDLADKAFDATSEFEESANKQIDSTVNTLSAILGLDEYKDSSIKNRIFAVFSSQIANTRKKVEFGDIIIVNRGLYQHYGVYIGEDRVIHYSSPDDDFFGASPIIREDHISKFLRDEKEYFVFDCENYGKHKLKIKLFSIFPILALIKSFLNIFKNNKPIQVYSPEETVQRAKSKIGENEYNLIVNNCEHFAIWCKTGLHESSQVDDVLNFLIPIPII